MRHITSSPAAPPVVGEKRPNPPKKDPPLQETRKVSSFIQRFYLFGSKPDAEYTETPTLKKAKTSERPVAFETCQRDVRSAEVRSSSAESTAASSNSSSDASKESSPVQQYPSYSVQRLRQFWNNRLLSGANHPPSAGASIDTLVRKAKSATIGAPTGAAARAASPKVSARFHRNGSIGRSGRRRVTVDVSEGADQRSTQAPKRTSHAALLSPDRDGQRQLVEKRPCVAPASASSSTRDFFPVAVSTPGGNRIHWARRTELLDIRSQTPEEKCTKMPLRAENYVASFIDVDIQSVPSVAPELEAAPVSKDAVGEALPAAISTSTPITPARQPNTASLGRKCNTPTRKISFLNNISPYNRKLLAGNGTKVAALTSKFNQMIQQDAGLLEQVKKRGGYLHKCGNVAYKVLEDPGHDGTGSAGYGFTGSTMGRGTGARSSLRRKHSSNASNATSGNRTDESSDEISSVSSKNSSIRKTGLKKRPSLRKNIYRRPDWEAGRSSLGVRKVLEMFEPNVHHHSRARRTESGGDTGKPPPGRAKPKVPDKSEQVLQKTKDIRSKKGSSRPVSCDERAVELLATETIDKVEQMKGTVDGATVREKLVEVNVGQNLSDDSVSEEVVDSPRETPDQGTCRESHTYRTIILSESTTPASEQVLAEEAALSDADASIGTQEVELNFGEPFPSHCCMTVTPERNVSVVSNGNGDTSLEPDHPADSWTEERERDEECNFGALRANAQSFGQTTGEETIATNTSDGSEQCNKQAVDGQQEQEVPFPPKQTKEKKKSKSTVSKIYERLTFRSSKKIVTPVKKSDEVAIVPEVERGQTITTTGSRLSFVSTIEIPAVQITVEPPVSPAPEPDTSEQKILDAISAVSQRIDNLSKSFNDLTLTESEEQENIQLQQEQQQQQQQQMRPNASFLFRGKSVGGSAGMDASSKHASQRNIVEAVNTVVINKSISMDDHHFPCSRGALGRLSLNERSRVQRQEDDYEVVTRPDEPSRLPTVTVSCSTPSITIDLTELTNKIESFVHKSKRESDNIYQCIPRKGESVASSQAHLTPDDTISINSYESFENYESIEHEGLSSTRQQLAANGSAREEDTYEICNPPPELPPARADSRNDLTLPQPKRNLSASPKTLPKHLQVTYQSNYERIKYSKIPPRPPKPDAEVPLPPRNSSTSSTAPSNGTPEGVVSSADLPLTPPGGDLLDKSPHGQENIYEENIYDTIRSAEDGVDYDDPAGGGSSTELDPSTGGTIQTYTEPHRSGRSQQHQPSPVTPAADSVSLVSSNCYESIGSRLEYVRNMALHRRNIGGGSTTTLASDQITNSLYGTTAGLASLTPPSERGSDTSNSADWTDISDEDEDNHLHRDQTTTTTTTTMGLKRPNFIVVRERKRTHQTPLRSRKLARISHQKIDDDSDHHYESLYSIGSNDGRQPHDVSPITSQSLPSATDGSTSGSTTVAGFHVHRGDPYAATLLPNDDEEFDSFDSDDTEYEDDDEERNRARTDSGVDIRNAKLPDPPPSSSQVYVLVQKIKSLGTLSKSEIAKSFHKLSKKKPAKASAAATYENTKPSGKSGAKAFKLPLPLVGGGGGVPKPPPEDYANAPAAPSATAGSSCSPLASSQSLSSVSTSSPYGGATALVSSPIAEQQSAGVRSTSESSNVSSNVLRSSQQAGGSTAAIADTAASRKKSKSTKSLRSKLRKSLVADSTSLNIGSSFNGSRSTFYVTTSADVDSGIFNGSDGCLNPCHGAGTPSKAPDDSRRRSIAVAPGHRDRPTIPPPPPPPPVGGEPGGKKTTSPLLLAASNKSSNRRLGATSWYAECGVFKQPHSFGAGSDQSLSGGKGSSISPRSSLPANQRGGEGGAGNGDRTLTANGASWYADIYQTTSGASVASSSESSGVSTGGEGGPGDDHSHSMFVNEPLYQIYNAAKLESITRDIDAEISGRTEESEELYDDGYEKIAERNRRRTTTADGGGGEPDEGGSTSGGSSSTEGDDSSMHLRKPARPSALELIEPHIGKLRTLWCEIPEVRNSEILSTLTTTEKRLQEAKFEILTSEASYLKSLNLLRTHFVNHPAFRDTRILSTAERKTLFSSIIPVQECSDRLLCDLEHCWQDNIMLLGLSHSIYKHADKHFHVYVSYCEHQARIDRTLKALKATKPEFARTLAALEADPVCCSLSLSSFLMLPMQRITRMRLLLDAVLQRCHPDDDEFAGWENTFVLINRILTQCNDAAHRSEQMHEMELLSRQIEFPTNVRPLPIVPCGIGAAPSTMHRKLEKRGELVHVLWRGDDAKLTFGKKFSKSNVYAFLFTDLLVLTKRKSDESYLVIDYCQRALLTVSSGAVVPGLPAKEMQTIGKNLIIMTLLENHEGKTIEMILSCPSETERERWLTVTEPPASENPDEKIYEQWDCPQVIAVHPYSALQPDELDLDIKDVVNVHRKMADGWYEGERIRDGAVGWFPSNYTKEIPSVHIRAKHIKQRHLLLTYTSKYIDTATKGYSHHQYHHPSSPLPPQQQHYQAHGKK